MVPPATARSADLSTTFIHQSRPSIHDFPDLCAPAVDNLWKPELGLKPEFHCCPVVFAVSDRSLGRDESKAASEHASEHPSEVRE